MSLSYIQTLTSVLRSAWRRQKPQLVRVPQDSTKIYEQTPPVWARWALVLVSVDVMVSTSAAEFIWNAWTMPDPDLAQQKDTTKGNLTDPGGAPRQANKSIWNTLQVIPPGHVLVPAWKRALSCSLFLVAGIMVAGSILSARGRFIRTISYVRASKETPGVPPSIYLQTAGHPRRFGHPYTIKHCSLRPSTKDQMMLEIKDHGKWILDMRGAKIAGRPVSEDKTLSRSSMLKTWKAIDGSLLPPL